jgi:hypothetical protein
MPAWRADCVKVSSLEDSLADYPYKVREYKMRTYSREESVERARARIGEDLYHPVFNKCEHFWLGALPAKQEARR